MQKQELARQIKAACKKLFNVDVEPEITRPEEQFGDYATNAALKIAGQAGKNPREVAELLISELKGLGGIESISLAGPGFMNFRLADDTLAKAALAATNLPKPLQGQEILVEFGDPNPFKEMHIGHLYSYIVGDSICRLLESGGARVRRLSYHGDVGLHVAKAVYGLRQLQSDDKQSFLGEAYSYGNKKYEEDEAARAEIEGINRHIYEQDDPEVNKLHEKGVKLSFDYFDEILSLLNISNDKRYFESQSTKPGLKLVKDNEGNVFKQSQDAVIYEGEKAGLHTRVFITSKGLPTYETKDLGLVELKDQDFPKASRSIVITANEQSEYFKVMLAALAEIKPGLAAKTTHISHGFLSLTTGKMSSRTGNVLTADAVLVNTKLAISNSFQEINTETRDRTMLAAVKYAFLKHRIGSDIVYNPKESVTIEGNSGPYLQYAHARACSILAKAGQKQSQGIKDLDDNERSLARKISEYPEVVEKAVNELMPHHVCTYLYELAQTFNSFYEKSRVIGDERQGIRIKLVGAYAQVLKSGLGLLNIAAPDKM